MTDREKERKKKSYVMGKQIRERDNIKT